MPANYTLIEKITVGAAGASSVTFSGIPQTGYTDLVIKFAARSSTTGTDNSQANLTFNGSSSGYSDRLLYGRGSSAASASSATSYITWAGIIPAAGATSSTFSNSEIYIPNYAGSTNKSLSSDNVQENNSATDNFVTMLAGLWSNSAAITSATLTCNGGSFVANSTFYLYGVAKLGTTPAIVPYATGGDTIMTDGTYWYHTFISSGTFTPQKGLSCDVLVVAGGGGGGTANLGGGGGAGGLYYSASNSVASAQTVTVGAGGASFASGSNSVFGSLTAAVGGGRGGHSDFGGGNFLPNTGGSGGGAGNNGTGAAGTSGQGNAGGGTPGNGGGGGGAGAAGSTMSNFNAVAGGIGSSTYSSWGLATGTGHNVSGTVYYAAGGASGAYVDLGGTRITTRASGGGGTSGGDTNASGIANTGGGGGGYTYTAGTEGLGGSGIVLVRYLV